MPCRLLAAKELAEIFKILSHPDRIRIVEELRVSERDVNTICQHLGMPPARMSQHLSLMRANGIVGENRVGRHVFYHLSQKDLAEWIIEGLKFVEARSKSRGMGLDMVERARELWSRAN